MVVSSNYRSHCLPSPASGTMSNRACVIDTTTMAPGAGLSVDPPHRSPGRTAAAIDALSVPSVANLCRSKGLTRREMETLALVAAGRPNRFIARAMGISLGTVKLHLTHAYAKLRLTHRSEVVSLFNRLCLEAEADGAPNALWAPWFPVEGQTVSRHKGDVLFNRADPGDRLYLLHQGVLELEGIGRTIFPGAVVGEIAVLTPVRTRTQTALCASDVELKYLTSEQACRYYYARPDFGFRMLRLITTHLMADRERRC